MRRGWFVLLGDYLLGGWGEVLAILAEVEEGVAELAVEGDEVAAGEFDALDVESRREVEWGRGRCWGLAGGSVGRK